MNGGLTPAQLRALHALDVGGVHRDVWRATSATIRVLERCGLVTSRGRTWHRTLAGEQVCAGERHRETLRLLVAQGLDYDVELILREREPWLFEDDADD